MTGSGVCYCGSDMEGHGVWDNHAPTEMMLDWTCPRCGWHTEDIRLENHICPEWHWAVIRAGNITVAQGYCRCDGSGKHFIERS